MADKPIKVDTWLPVFPGFYGTWFEMDDSKDEQEREYIAEYVDEPTLAACMLDNFYSSGSYAKWCEEYRQSVANHAVRYIRNELKDYVSEIKFQELVSPREYNFSNDSINIEVYLSAKDVAKIRRFIQKHAEEWATYLKSRYTSCSGFISYHSSSPDAIEWKITNALADTHNAGAVLQFLCEILEITDEDMYETFEDVTGIDIDAYRQECIDKGWYEPENLSESEKRLIDERRLRGDKNQLQLF